MNIGFVQMCPFFGKKEENLQKAESLIQKEKADLLVLPELFSTGYLFADKEELLSLAEEIPQGKTARFLQHLSHRTKISLVFGIAERYQRKLYNSAVLVTPQGGLHVYRKLQLFNEEKALFDPGDKEPEVFDLGEVKVGIMVCFDWLFPEIARVIALKGADVICHPSNLVLPYAQGAMLTRSLENGVYTVTCNRVGSEKRANRQLSFTGKSQVTSPKGELLLRASEDVEEIGIVKINPFLAREKRFTENNFIFEDRKPMFYKRILEN